MKASHAWNFSTIIAPLFVKLFRIGGGCKQAIYNKSYKYAIIFTLSVVSPTDTENAQNTLIFSLH